MPESLTETSDVHNGTQPSMSGIHGQVNSLTDFVHPMGVEGVMKPSHVMPASLPEKSAMSTSISIILPILHPYSHLVLLCYALNTGMSGAV